MSSKSQMSLSPGEAKYPNKSFSLGNRSWGAFSVLCWLRKSHLQSMIFWSLPKHLLSVASYCLSSLTRYVFICITLANVRQNHHTIFREMNVRLYRMRSCLHSAHECAHSVLWMLSFITSMRNCLREFVTILLWFSKCPCCWVVRPSASIHSQEWRKKLPAIKSSDWLSTGLSARDS